MTTRAVITVRFKDHYQTTMCESDGYPEHLLKTLKKSYKTPAQAHALSNMGDASYIGEKIEPIPENLKSKKPFNLPDRLYNEYVKYSQFYHRDKNESLEDVAPLIHKLPDDHGYTGEYEYLFNGKEWKLVRGYE